MQINYNFFTNTLAVLSSIFGLSLSLFLVACGSGSIDGPAIEARSQSIDFNAAPVLNINGTVIVSATASSALNVNFSSTTPDVCTVTRSGIVTAVSPGDCIIAANQSGNATYAPAAQVTQRLPVIFDSNQVIIFTVVPQTLPIFATATVSATASSGLAIDYSSATPAICSVVKESGIVTGLAVGECIVVANQPGNIYYNAASPLGKLFKVFEPSIITEPGAPTEVTAIAENVSTVVVSFGATESGGRTITEYIVSSVPEGVSGVATESPITVSCSENCTGYAFSVVARNEIGDSESSALVDVITKYNVIETFFEPLTQPKNSIFIGTFTFNSTTRTVSNLQGLLSEPMTGDLIAYPDDNMSWLSLNNLLSSVNDPVLGGLLVTTFLHSDSFTLSIDFGEDGWSPGTGGALHFNVLQGPTANPGNAYARIFINTENPTAPLTQAQINKLAYADCAPGGMMGQTCMTGTTEAGYNVQGSMDGYPLSQVITRQP